MPVIVISPPLIEHTAGSTPEMTGRRPTGLRDTAKSSGVMVGVVVVVVVEDADELLLLLVVVVVDSGSGSSAGGGIALRSCIATRQ
jgi:hypothetical protein